MKSARYGASNRKLVEKAINSKKAKYECPKCNKIKLTRKSYSLWNCKSCDATFAGGAYSFSSETGDIAKRLIAEYSK